jgi:hypothetical protein
VRPSRHALLAGQPHRLGREVHPHQPGPGAGGDLQAAAPRPQATSSMVSPGDRRSASATSAIAAQPPKATGESPLAQYGGGHRGLAGPVAVWSSYRSCAQNYQIGAVLVLIAIGPAPVQNV